jgi:2-succinyl-5-enolpyruvyl-6-hydroxy-3-cyclohexene-1-carboxylate synthase
VSSAAGAALADPERRAWLLTGELALLHDLGGLLAAGRAGARLTIVCADNGGGAIFDFLPVAEHADPGAYERHIATPAGVDLERVAALAGLPHRVARAPEEVRAAATEPGLVVVPSDRAENLIRHRELTARVVSELGG